MIERGVGRRCSPKRRTRKIIIIEFDLEKKNGSRNYLIRFPF